MDSFARLTDCHEKIAALHGDLLGRVEQGERERQVARENIDALAEAGVYKVFQPQRFGGSEFAMADVLPMITQIARACPSTAWVSAVLQIHTWLMGLSTEQAQDEVFGENSSNLVCGVLQPKGVMHRVDGGYQVMAGTWPYASGCDFASWAHLGGMVMHENGPPEPLIFAVPAKDYNIVDDWQVTGLRATGSKSLVINEQFVPEHRVINTAAVISGDASKHLSALYRSALVPMLCLNVTGPALGAAQSAIEVFIAHIENRNLPFSPHKQVASSQAQQVLGEVIVKTDSAEMLLERSTDLVLEFAEATEVMPLAQRMKIRAYCSAAVRLCVEAIETLFLNSGGTALQETHALQRLNRDAKAMAVHAALSHENNLELLGASFLGQSLNSQFV